MTTIRTMTRTMRAIPANTEPAMIAAVGIPDEVAIVNELRGRLMSRRESLRITVIPSTWKKVWSDEYPGICESNTNPGGEKAVHCVPLRKNVPLMVMDMGRTTNASSR